MRFCVYATSTSPTSRGFVAARARDTRPLLVADGGLHGARPRDAWTLCGVSTTALARVDDRDFETVTISAGGCQPCMWAIDEAE
jgi:hypothetical protein